MHECHDCGMYCDCDGEDHDQPQPADCICDCFGEDDEDPGLGAFCEDCNRPTDDCACAFEPENVSTTHPTLPPNDGEKA